MFLKPVHGETVTHAGKFPLKFVQHRGGKVGASYKIGRKQRNLPFVCRGSKVGFGLAGTIDIYIGELFISHFDRLFKTRSLVASASSPVLLIALDTVLRETPSSSAMS